MHVTFRYFTIFFVFVFSFLKKHQKNYRMKDTCEKKFNEKMYEKS
jgi:hypothetical protein